jgi:Ca-activated chloride channel family protein
VWLWRRWRRSKETNPRVQEYADAHLLPYLLRPRSFNKKVARRRFVQWTLLWVLGILALAGPRWDFADVELFEPTVDLVVLFDLSASMEVDDVRPNRLARARQEVEDLVAASRGARIGLIAFASFAYVVSPITDDRDTLRRNLPYLTTDLVRWSGSRLAKALDKAQRLLMAQPEENSRAVLLISDGDFDEPDLEEQVERLVASGARLHVLGIGSHAGGLVPGPAGRPLREQDGNPVISRLDESLLKDLASAGGGIYRRADYRDEDTRELIERVTQYAPVRESEQDTRRIWNERYYLLVALMVLLLLPKFRGRSRGDERETEADHP